MYNDILSIGPITIHGYGLMIAIGVVAALLIGEARANKRGLSGDILYPLTGVCVLSGFLGAKLLFCIVEWKTFIQAPLEYLGTNGFVVYGGIIGGVFGGWLFCVLRKLPFWRYFDIVMPSVAIAQAFGRIGCFLAGCCYGAQTDAWYGIAFQNSKFAPNGVKLIPTQLISSAGMFLVAGILIWYARRERKPGRVGAWYLILYSIGRFFLEYLRNDHRGTVGNLSTSQFISVGIVVVGIVILVTRQKADAGSAGEGDKVEAAKKGK